MTPLSAHETSGESFRLVLAPGGAILAVAAETETGRMLVDLDDPVAWAQAQKWRFP